ncbi:hypothetical protein JVU11DRAFT_1001 [Chiua virens]|nr:hypothetical protein JVU11DRAFT_1001 [Chiua virens]
MKHTLSFGDDDPTLDYIATHVFFPIEVPEESDYTIENDLSLARAAYTAVRAYSAHIDDALKPCWGSIEKTLENLQVSAQSGHLRKDDMISQLHNMQSGDVLALLIRAQQAGVIFRKQENHTLYESFEASPSRDAVLHTPGGLVYTYSQLAVEVPNSVFDDPHFQTELANFLSRPGDVEPDPPNVPPSHPEYITSLLNGILRSVGRTVETTGVLKHVRDEVGALEEEDGWRRSSLWLLIRIAIQTSLDRSTLGRVTYKVFMLFFICNLANDANNAGLSSDLLHLMSAKVLRRLRKLGSSAPSWISDMALKTCACLQDTLEVRAVEIQNTKPRSPYWNPSELDLVNDTRLSLPLSDEYIRNALANHAPLDPPAQLKDYVRGTLEDFLSSDISFFDRAYSTDPYVALYDLERSVEEDIDDWIAHVTDVNEACTQLGNLMEVYLSSASIPYMDNPEYRSIMALTAIELWVALDKLVIEEIPILAEYSPEIPIWLLQSLLLREDNEPPPPFPRIPVPFRSLLPIACRTFGAIRWIHSRQLPCSLLREFSGSPEFQSSFRGRDDMEHSG